MSPFEVGLNDRGYFKLTPFRWLDLRRDLYDVTVAKIQPGDRPLALGPRRLLGDGKDSMIPVELHHPKPLRVHHLIRKYRRTLADRCLLLQQSNEALAVKYVVSENQAYRATRDELLTDDERLCETLWARLYTVAQVDAEL